MTTAQIGDAEHNLAVHAEHKRVGRPALPPNLKRSIEVRCKMNAAERAHLEAVAAAQGVTMGECIRRLVAGAEAA